MCEPATRRWALATVATFFALVCVGAAIPFLGYEGMLTSIFTAVAFSTAQRLLRFQPENSNPEWLNFEEQVSKTFKRSR